jgi:hypothetical protein
MVKVPARVAPALASKVKMILALPVPLALPAATCSHVALAVAVHVPVEGVTASTTESVPAAGPSRIDEEPRV